MTVREAGTTAPRSRSAGPHADAIRVSFDDVVRFLLEHLGVGVVSIIVDANVRTVRRWRDGATTPREVEHERKLRDAYQIFRELQAVEDATTVRAWFMGMNPQLDDLSPAEALAQGRRRDVLAAGRAFVAGG